MQLPMLEVMAHIDNLCEQMPTETFEQLATMKFSWPQDSADPVVVAASRMLDGLWLYYLGNWCPEDRNTFTWKESVIISTEDAPLGYALMMAGIALRSAGCRLASRFASPERLAEVRAQVRPAPSRHERDFRDGVFAWMEQLYEHVHDKEDWFGNRLPESVYIVSSLYEVSMPYRKQGNTSVVTPIAIGRQPYFVKRLIQPGPLLTLLEAFQNECAITAVLNVLPWKLGPHTGCLYAGDDGALSYLSNKVPGVTMTDIRKAASRVSLAAVQAAVLAEFIGSIKDRHHENVFIDRFHAQPWLIDFAHALDDVLEPLHLPDARLPLAEQRESFTRALWSWHPDCVRTFGGETVILDDVLMGILTSREAILTALAPFDVSASSHTAVAQRFDALDRLTQHEGEKTLESLNRLMST